MDKQTMEGRKMMENLSSKEKRANFWYYYKGHVIVVIIVIILLGITIRECANKVEDDLTVTYLSEKGISDDVVNRMKDLFTECIVDINGDAEKNVFISSISGSLSDGSEQGIAAYNRYMAEIGTGYSMGFIMDKAYYDSLVSIYPDIIEYSYDMSKNPLLVQALGISADDNLYWVTKCLYKSEEKNNKRIKMNENAVRVYQVISSEK